MQHCGSKYGVFNPTTKKWAWFTDYAEAVQTETEWLYPPQTTGLTIELLSTRPYTSKGRGRYERTIKMGAIVEVALGNDTSTAQSLSANV